MLYLREGVAMRDFERFAGRYERDPYIGLLWVFDSPTVLWLDDVCEFTVSEYVVVEPYE